MLMWALELGAPCLAPISADMKLILEIGCGTGIWSRTIALQNAETQVVGVDISPPIEGELGTATGGNCRFVKADVEEPWSFLERQGTVDLTFARLLTTAIHDWQGLFDKAFEATKPGGYFESQETAVELSCDDNDEAKRSSLMEWFQCLAEYSISNKVEPLSVDTHGIRLERAGFKLVEERPVVWYLSSAVIC